MRGILTIAHLTVAEARRRRIVFAAILVALVFILFFSTALFFAHRDMIGDPKTSFPERQMTLALLTVLGLFAANFLSVAFSLLLPIDTLSGEIDSGVMQTLAAKPLDRSQIVLGKWAGNLMIAMAYLLGNCLGLLLAVRLIVGFIPVNFPPALPLMLLEITLLLSVSVAGSARLNTITNGVVVLAFYAIAFVGGFVEQVGSVTGVPSARNLGILVSLISPADAVWRLALYYMQPSLVRAMETPLTIFSVPTFWMVWWAVGFTGLTLVYAVRTFARRNL
jgi:ABC-type transport system involved in multi-copper enzyme maturation permease subunit